MNLKASSFGRSLASVLLVAMALAANGSHAAPISMPTPQGSVNFDGNSFATAILAGPSGEFACFSGGVLSACSASSLQLAVLGPDLTTGLTLGVGGSITLAVPAIGSGLVIWEAGAQGVAGDVGGSLVSLHTASGWTAEHAYSSEHSALVLSDTQPSGYPTNFGGFSVTDFGIASGTVFDAVRIRSCCGANAHVDILAVAVVPEPTSTSLFLAGLLAISALTVRRRKLSFR